MNYPPLRISLSFWVDLVGACNSIVSFMPRSSLPPVLPHRWDRPTFTSSQPTNHRPFVLWLFDSFQIAINISLVYSSTVLQHVSLTSCTSSRLSYVFRLPQMILFVLNYHSYGKQPSTESLICVFEPAAQWPATSHGYPIHSLPNAYDKNVLCSLTQILLVSFQGFFFVLVFLFASPFMYIARWSHGAEIVR